MINSIKFENFRNLDGKYSFKNVLNVVIGKNNSGKTNILEGIKLAFSSITNDYFRILKSDFKDSIDSNAIKITVELKNDSIPSFNFFDEDKNKQCGFTVSIRKTQSGRYIKNVTLLNGSPIDIDIIRDDPKIPNLYFIPLIRIEDIYTAGLSTGISTFIESEEKYKELKNESKKVIKEELGTKTKKFKELCGKFNQNLDIELTDPKITNEKVYIVDGKSEHNFNIGAGYKSIANIMLNTLDEKFNIILIDEIENHLHPALIRTLIRELRNVTNTIIISTSHSPVVINEIGVEEIIDISRKNIYEQLDKTVLTKINTFLHPGRNELMLADNIILVEGYTEEILLKYYLKDNNYNWTVVNVAGVMFEPYIELATLLGKKTIVISDNDKALSEGLEKSSRFKKLINICNKKSIKIIEVENTLETDLFNNKFLTNCENLLKKHDKHPEIFIAREKRKMDIVQKIIEENVDLSKWHVIKEIDDEFKSN
ncbi:MAG: AAA family ATPase [Clostridia bacterium]|nr:AAA family ATPase [Clostridia bacterium]